MELTVDGIGHVSQRLPANISEVSWDSKPVQITNNMVNWKTWKSQSQA